MRLKLEDIIILIILLSASYIFIYYGSQSDIWFPDEGFYGMYAKEVAKGNLPFTILEIKDKICPGHLFSKPPLPIYLMSLFYLFGGEIGFKLFTPVMILFLIFSIYFISRKFINKWLALLTSILPLGIPLFIDWSIATYTDIFSALIFLWFFYFFYNVTENPTKKNIIISGIFIGLNFLTKETTMAIIPMTLLLYLIIDIIINRNKLKLINEIKVFILILIIGLLITIPHFLRNYLLFHNPIFPFFPNIFGWEYLDKEGYYLVPKGQNAWVEVNLQYFWINFSYFLLILLATFILSIIKIKKLNNDNLSNFVIDFTPKDIINLDKIFISTLITSLFTYLYLSPSKDIRYLLILIPISLPIFSYKISIFKKWNFIILIMLCVFSFYNIFSILPTTLMKGKLPENEKVLYNFIKANTTKDAILFDVYTGTTAYHTERSTMFPTTLCGYDLWGFWNLTNDEMYNLFKKHGINYIIFHLNFMTENETPIWGIMPINAIYKLLNTSFVSNSFMIDNWAVVLELKGT